MKILLKSTLRTKINKDFFKKRPLQCSDCCFESKAMYSYGVQTNVLQVC